MSETVTIDPTETIDPIQEQPKKSRGRPSSKPGGSKPSGKKEKISARQLTGLLYLGHAGAANAAGIPELEITEGEAEQIAGAIVDVLQHYDFEASAKTLAWANLAGTLATVYGLKIWAILQKPRPIDGPGEEHF